MGQRLEEEGILMRPDFIQVYKAPDPLPGGMKRWQVEAVKERMFDDEVLTGWQFDDRETAVSIGRQEAEEHKVDLIVEGKHVAGVKQVDDWHGAQWQEFGGFK